MVNVEKHPHASLKYPGSTVMSLPAGDSELEPPFCQTCLSDHPFQRGIAPQEAESCSWESQRNSKVSHSFLPTNFVYMFCTDNRSVLTMDLYLRDCVPLEENACSKTRNYWPRLLCTSELCFLPWNLVRMENKRLFTKMLRCTLIVFEQISSNNKYYFLISQILRWGYVILACQDNEKDTDLLIFSLLSNKYKPTLHPLYPPNHV